MVLSSADSDKALVKLCTCNKQEVCAPPTEDVQDGPIDDTTEIGFATAAATELERYRNPQEDQVLGDEKPETEDDSQTRNDLDATGHDAFIPPKQIGKSPFFREIWVQLMVLTLDSS